MAEGIANYQKCAAKGKWISRIAESQWPCKMQNRYGMRAQKNGEANYHLIDGYTPDASAG